MKVTKPVMDLVKGLQPRKRQRPDMNTEIRRDHEKNKSTEADSCQR